MSCRLFLLVVAHYSLTALQPFLHQSSEPDIFKYAILCSSFDSCRVFRTYFLSLNVCVCECVFGAQVCASVCDVGVHSGVRKYSRPTQRVCKCLNVCVLLFRRCDSIWYGRLYWGRTHRNVVVARVCARACVYPLTLFHVAQCSHLSSISFRLVQYRVNYVWHTYAMCDLCCFVQLEYNIFCGIPYDLIN